MHAGKRDADLEQPVFEIEGGDAGPDRALTQQLGVGSYDLVVAAVAIEPAGGDEFDEARDAGDEVFTLGRETLVGDTR